MAHRADHPSSALNRASGPGFDFSGLSDLANTLSPFLALFGPQNIATPAFQLLVGQGLGRQQTRQLQEITPTLDRLPDDFGRVNIPGRGVAPISIAGATQQAIDERQEAFEQLQNQQQDQAATIARFRNNVADATGGLRAIDFALQRTGLQNQQQLRAGLLDVWKSRKASLGFLAGGLRFLADQISQIKSGNAEVLENIDVDITARSQELRRGIEAQNNAVFNQLESALDSSSPLTADERSILRNMRDLQTGTDMAIALGQLHETAAEFKGRVATDLQNSLTNARAVATQAATGLFVNTQDAMTAADRAATDLRINYTNQNRLINTARAELATFGAEFQRLTGVAEFEMVSRMTRPVAVFSDLLFDSFDAFTDALQFNNNTALQQAALDASALNPQFAAGWAAIANSTALIENERNRESAEDQTSEMARAEIISGALQGAGSVGGGFAARG